MTDLRASLFYLPSVGSRADIERGRAGLDPELYRTMLAELGEQARLADDLGYDSISFTEHHFHVEGFELSNNPVLLDLFVAHADAAHARRPARHRAAGAATRSASPRTSRCSTT